MFNSRIAVGLIFSEMREGRRRILKLAEDSGVGYHKFATCLSTNSFLWILL